MDGNVQLYDKLLQLPLFQGMSHDDLTLVVGHTKIGFHKLSAGRLLVKDGDILSLDHKSRRQLYSV